MTHEWRKRKLGQLARVKSGFSFKSSQWTGSGVPVVKIGNVKRGRLEMEGCSFVTEADARNSGFLLSDGDILIGLTGYVGEVAKVRAPGALVLNQRVGKFFPNDGCDHDFLYFLVSNEEFRQRVTLASHGSAQANVSPNAIESLEVTVPPPPVQRAIAATLAGLDDKIELNRRMNETLEEMARAIFKDWFVDFGPTRAKAEGREPYLAPELWDLFPHALNDEDRPVGWTEASIYEFSEVIYGAPFASKQFNSENLGVPLIRIRDLATHAPGVSTEQVHKKGHKIEPGEIVVGMDGEFRLHIWKGPRAWLNQRVCHFEPKPGIPKSFLAEALKEPLAFFERGKVGTTVIHLGKSDIDTFKLTHPGDGVLGAFATIVEPLLERTVTNVLESCTLAQTRDLLLPKLVSGEVRLAEAAWGLESVV